MNFRRVTGHKYLETFNFSSLTDVVMQLLIFFLLTFSFVQTRGMNIALPRAGVSQTPQQPTITISIGKDRKIFLNNELVLKEQLGPRLSSMFQQRMDQQIVVRADQSLSLQEVVEILDVARGSGATRLFIATDKPTEIR